MRLGFWGPGGVGFIGVGGCLGLSRAAVSQLSVDIVIV